MIKIIKEWLKILSLSNSNNWRLHISKDWSYEVDGWSRPSNCYKHKKYSYTITNAFFKKQIPFQELIKLFLEDYKTNNLIFGETFYIVSK